MSTHRPEPDDLRRRLLDAAARILTEQGPAALSARRLVKEVGASTMAVYTHFGSMPGLVRELMRDGFARFHALGTAESARHPADPVAEVAGLSRAYQEFARAEPDVYAVMFGGSALAGFTLSDDDRRIGAYGLRSLRDALRRCTAAGRFRPDTDTDLLVRQLFSQLHGLAQLTRAGYIMGDYTPDQVLRGMLLDFASAAGDEQAAARASVATGLRSASRPGSESGSADR
ncbi:TetR/AcrR family transcriptional regulator [Streptomyces sp. NPDC091292]|uniref:TetR/AcrR family transcriptional regulator n=1 Tax=Streptomyces sp. NPDC091292 TaxID=3365991 RepID=UPI0038217F32